MQGIVVYEVFEEVLQSALSTVFYKGLKDWLLDQSKCLETANRDVQLKVSFVDLEVRGCLDIISSLKSIGDIDCDGKHLSVEGDVWVII
jgi:hypothetical protein